jgi:N-acetylneuraminic acid mutarotase
MADRFPPRSTDSAADEALRSYHADLERSATPHPAFGDELFESLGDAGGHDARNAVLGALGLAAALAGIAIVVTVAFLAGNPSRDPAASGTPRATDPVAAASPTTTPQGTPTLPPTASPSQSPSPSASPSVSPSPSAPASTPPATTAPATPAPPTQPPGTGPAPTPIVVAGEWESVAPLPSLPAASIADVESAADERLYVLLWSQTDAANAPLYAYDPARNEWSDVTSPGSASASGSFLLAGRDGLLYHFLGRTNETWMWVFDPQRGEWQGDRQSLPIDRMVDAVAARDGRVLFIVDGTDSARTTTQAAALDLATGEVEPLASVSGVFGPYVELGTDGRMYAIGRSGMASYDPVADRWRREGGAVPVSDPTGLTFAAVADDRLYVATEVRPGLENLVAWDPGLGRWVGVQRGPSQPEQPALGQGRDGRLYAIETGGQPLDPRPKPVAAFEPAAPARD